MPAQPKQINEDEDELISQDFEDDEGTLQTLEKDDDQLYSSAENSKTEQAKINIESSKDSFSNLIMGKKTAQSEEKEGMKIIKFKKVTPLKERKILSKK